METPQFEQICDLITMRRSIFPASYTEREISRETLLRILECADAAPTHKRTQPWRFKVFRKEGRQLLAEALGSLYNIHTPAEKFSEKRREEVQRKVLTSGAVIAICVAYTGEVPEWEELAATSCAVQNLWLAASAAGIGGYWSTPGYIKHLDTFLQLPDHTHCIGLFYMGYHEEPTRSPNRSPISDKITWEEG